MYKLYRLIPTSLLLELIPELEFARIEQRAAPYFLSILSLKISESEQRTHSNVCSVIVN